MATARVRIDSLRMGSILGELRKCYPAPECALTHRNAFELLVATILSAQCTDERVNLVTPGLFARWPTAAALAQAPQAELEAQIRSTGFFRNKAKNLLGAARTLVQDFGGEVPKTMEQLLTLPGVARKTANVVLGTAFGIAAGVVVDTHVTRLSHLLGLTTHADPVKIEADLCRLVPKEQWIWFSHALIWHGRKVCIARRPDCGSCALQPHCPSANAAGVASKKAAPKTRTSRVKRS